MAPTSYQAPMRGDKHEQESHSQTVESNLSHTQSTVTKILERKGDAIIAVRPADTIHHVVELMKDKGIGAEKTREDHADLYNQLYAAYARGKEMQELATIMGEAALSEEDRKYMEFANKFEARYISQNYYENRTVFETLDLGWELLSMFENVELKRIDIKLIEKYMPKFRKGGKGAEGTADSVKKEDAE